MKKLIALCTAVLVVGGLAACTDDGTSSRNDQLHSTQNKFDNRKAPEVTGDAEYNNYIKAQQDVYDDPASIIWCTVFPDSPASPIFTVPIAGKLTSSSVSFFPNASAHTNSNGVWVTENQSVDGMYHGSPPPYRYGFTPGGQYVDFFNLPTFCTTSLTSFQRSTLKVASAGDSQADTAQKQAEQALKDGDNAKAQDILDGLSK